MSPFDLSMLGLVAALTVWGAIHGLVRQLTALGAIVAGVLVAATFLRPVAAWIGGSEPANLVGAAIILFFATSLAVHLVGSHVRAWLAQADLAGFDRQMGALFGAAQGAALAAVVTVVVFYGHAPARDVIRASRTACQVASFVEEAEPLLPPQLGQRLAAAIEPLHDACQRLHEDRPPLFVADTVQGTRAL